MAHVRRSRAFAPAVLGVLLAAILSGPAAAAESSAGLRNRIDAILARYPAADASKKDKLAAELMATGREGILEVCRRLAGPGQADDATARFAVDSLTLRADRPGTPEKDRILVVGALCDALDGAGDPEVRDFLISQVQIAGKNEAVKPLSRYLSDERLGDPAVRALRAVGTQEAAKALLKALASSPATPNRIAIVIALGDLRSRPAAKIISRLADGPDPGLRDAALGALAEIGEPAGEAVLSRIPVASSVGERYRAAERYLLFARRRAEAGDKARAASVARNIISKFDSPSESGIRSQALTLLADVLGGAALGDLVAAVDSPDRGFRARALDIARTQAGPEITKRWLEKLAQAGPEARADIIVMLGRRGDNDALPAVKEALAGPEEPVRRAAMEAAVRLGGSAVLPDLLPIVRTAGPEESETLKTLLLSSSSPEAVAFAAAAFPEASLPARKALIFVLASREARDHAGLVFEAAAAGDPEVRAAALEALASVVRESDIGALCDLLVSAPSSAEARPLQNAVTAAAGRIADPEKRADAVLSALDKAPAARKPDLIRCLAGIGGGRALGRLVACSGDPDPQIQTAAVASLAGWKDWSAAAPLFAVVRDAVDRKYAYLALQGYVRLVVESEKPAAEKLALLESALGQARDAAEKKVVVGGFGSIRGVEAFRAAAAWLGDPEVRPRAAAALARVAMPVPGEPGLRGIAAARTLKRAALFIESDWTRGLAEDYAEEILAAEGLAPLFNGEDLTGWQGLVEDPVKRAKLAPAELTAAQRKADEDMRLHWKADGGRLVFDGKGHSLCTAREYRDFEMFVDWKIESGGDSGIYLRGAPQIQIWDPAQWPEGSGGLYNNKTGPSKPLKFADNPVGSWNTFHIIMKGERVTVYLNDVLVVDGAVMENYWERDKPIYPVGRIELQAHSTPLFFRNIRLREI